MWVKVSCAVRGFNRAAIDPSQERSMKAIVDLFSTDYGLMSAGVILFIIVMAVWFQRFFARKIAESERAARKP